jgi:hypothetical protein
MNIRVPASGNAAKIAKAFLKTQGIEIKHAQALELVARLHGYKDNQAMQADVNFADPMALAAESNVDFEFKGPRNSSVWISVENISVYVKRADEGVIVDLYKKGCEDEESLAGTYLEYNEAMDVCEACGSEVHDGYCKDMTCYYSDWPQWVPPAEIESMTRPALEKKYGVKFRDVSGLLSAAWDRTFVRNHGDKSEQGWWWHEAGKDSDEAQVLAGSQGVDFDGPYDTIDEAAWGYVTMHTRPASATRATATTDSFARSEEIKAKYLQSGCSRHDVQEAMDALREHCSDIFDSGTNMWEFLMEEPHEDKEASDFEPQPVDWAVVAEEENICALMFDKNNEREIVSFAPDALKELARVKDLSNRLSLGKRSAYQYTVAEAGGVIQTVDLHVLQGAHEYEPGYIDLKDGRVLQLLKRTAQGQFRRFSPALNDYVAE